MALSFPEQVATVQLNSWPNVAIGAAVTLTVGNAWFALNRYGLHQLVDWALWRYGFQSPARTTASKGYLDDLGRYASRSLRLDEKSARAQQHVAHRASVVLLLLTIGELAMLFAVFHSSSSAFEKHGCALGIAGLVVLVVGVWQMAITRRIDHYVVNHEGGAA
jgi:hypothetical protein